MWMSFSISHGHGGQENSLIFLKVPYFLKMLFARERARAKKKKWNKKWPARRACCAARCACRAHRAHRSRARATHTAGSALVCGMCPLHVPFLWVVLHWGNRGNSTCAHARRTTTSLLAPTFYTRLPKRSSCTKRQDPARFSSTCGDSLQ